MPEWFSSEVILCSFSPEHLAMFEDILIVVIKGFYWHLVSGEARDAANHPTGHRTVPHT